MNTKGFHIGDYLVFVGVLLFSLAIGLYHAFTGGKQRTTKEFLVGNRGLHVIPVTLSILVSFVSAILVLGTPAEMYTRGTLLLMRTIGYCFACVLSSLLFVPLFFPLKITSSFEYLDRRYKSRLLRLMAVIMMLFGQTFYMGLVLYSPSIALEAVTGFPFLITVIVTGAVAIIYTTVGGMKAVVWADTFQALVMIGGLLAIVIYGTVLVGGIEKVWTISQEGGRLIWVNFDLDPTERLTSWSLVIGGLFSSLTIFGIGQTSVQRYCSVPTLKQAKLSVYLNIPGILILNLLASFAGLVIYAYYTKMGCDPLKGNISNENQIVPYFIMDVMNYPGIPGLFIAVLFSGALSSISSSLNAASAVTWIDILKPHFKNTKELTQAAITKVLVVVFGMAGMGVAFAADLIGGHVLWASLSFTGATTGPSLGIFLLGALFRFTNAKGAIAGCVLGTALNLWIAMGAFVNRPHKERLSTVNNSCTVSNMSHLTYLYNETDASNQTGILEISPTSFSTTSALNMTSNIAEIQQPKISDGLNALYSLSFLWYCALGAFVTMIVGLVVSALTGGNRGENVDDKLIIPVWKRLCCFWSKGEKDDTDETKESVKPEVSFLYKKEGFDENGTQQPKNETCVNLLLNGNLKHNISSSQALLRT